MSCFSVLFIYLSNINCSEMVDHSHMAWPPYPPSVQHLQFLAQAQGRASGPHPSQTIPHHVQRQQLQAAMPPHEHLQPEVTFTMSFRQK